jgi:23S rRNA-/tRNA-specific pseudouridylate synthase
MTTSIEIIYETQTFGALNKPPLIHSTGKDSVEEWLGERGKLVQRLDFETSGVMLFEKTPCLKDLIKRKLIIKNYLCLVSGKLSKPVLVGGYLGSRYRGSKKVSYSKTKKDRFREFETKITPIKLIGKNTLVSAETRTGLRHQVRASCAIVGHPLVGDFLYGGGKSVYPFFLHAESVILPDGLVITCHRYPD